MDLKEIEISVIKYDSEYTKRSKDIKRNTWFSFPNDVLLHPDFTEINGEELKWFIWVVSICSKLNQNKIRLNINHAEKIVSLKRKDLFSMIEKLQGKQIDTDARPDGGRGATDGGRGATSTLHNTTLHNITNTTNNTLQTITSPEPEKNNLPTQAAKAVDVVEFKISASKSISIKKDLIAAWSDTYPKEYLDLSIKELRNWVLSNEHKAPKSAWAKFMNSWFQRGWERYRTTLKSQPTKLTVDDLNEILGAEL